MLPTRLPPLAGWRASGIYSGERVANHQHQKYSRLLVLIINVRFGTHPARVFFFFFFAQTKGKRQNKKKAICRLAEGLTVIWFIPHVVCKLTSPLTQRHAWTSHYKQDLSSSPPLCLCIVVIKQQEKVDGDVERCCDPYVCFLCSLS